MKIKFGDLTINQTIEICKWHYNGIGRIACNECPLYDERFGCIAFGAPYAIKQCDLNEREINLPDEEEKK